MSSILIDTINNTMNDIRYLTAGEAASELGVSRATLYAYVSRGLIRSEASGGGRSRVYRAEDVKLLRDRKTPGREPATDGHALAWGAPVLDSTITLIADGRLFYRGRDAARLARTATLETVAAILWECGGEDPFADNRPPEVEPPPGLVGIDRSLALLAAAAPGDLRAFNLEPAGVARTGARLVRLLAAGMAGIPASTGPIHQVLARGWEASHPAASDLIRAALVLLADHELNASAFTVRCIASTGAAPYAAVTGGLCALQGPRHGGETARVEAMLREIEHGEARSAMAERMRRGDRLSGFGHILYPDGDPRARSLLQLIESALPDGPALALGRALAEAVRDLTGTEPNVDFALSVMGRALGLPAHAPLGIFAVGRCVGWIAHAREQYATRTLIRPRSRYVGEMPEDLRTP